MKKVISHNEEQLTKYEADLLYSLSLKPFVNQRILAEENECSLGVVNRVLKNLKEKEYLDERFRLTGKSHSFFEVRKPMNAIILAAGLGMRMVPVNSLRPKGLIEVKGERLIDRLIVQLHEVGIRDITVVVGFMKESFEYLIDEYGVDLVVNQDYKTHNNLHSLALVADRIQNTYIIPCDIWCETNPFKSTELYSWYMVSDLLTEESDVRVNRKKELVAIPKTDAGNAMIGISYLLEPEAGIVKEKLAALDNERHREDFWEIALYKKDRMIVQARVVRKSNAVEINTYEQLRNFDSNSNHLKSDAIYTIMTALGCRKEDIQDITVLKKGMTNRSFLFTVDGSKYIMRIPGEGTDQLINRKQEAEVYRTISGLGLCDDPIYINPENGYKITKFLEGIRVCDSESLADLRKCMTKLRQFHAMKLKVNHTFNIFEQIEFYESLWEDTPSVYQDYARTKELVFSLKSFIDGLKKDWYLTHIDAVPDNFLFYICDGQEEENLQLTDWEYSGMQDPHVDIAMFCIYSLYNKRQCDCLIDIYFENNCDHITRAKIYAYIAMCGLLWSNWCEYKRKFGIEFGEYSLRQYRYAKDYYRYATELIEEEKKKNE